MKDELITSYLRQEYSMRGYMESRRIVAQDARMILENLWQTELRIIARHGIHWRSLAPRSI